MSSNQVIAEVLNRIKSEEFRGPTRVTQAALRALRDGGRLVFSHSVFASDPFTERVGLADVRALLEARIRGQIQELEGPAQSWLVVKDVHTRGESPET